MRILGIDPGYALLGYGVIDTDGRSATAVDYGVVETKSGSPFPERLQRLYDGVSQLVEMYRPDCAVFEELFFYHNITTAISVGAGRGVAITPYPLGGTPYNVKVLPIVNDIPQRELYLMWNKNRYIPPAAEYFRDFVTRNGRVFDQFLSHNGPSVV